MEIIRCNNLNKFYEIGKSKEQILKNLSFTVNENELLFIQGVSGSGKTTLLNILGLLDYKYSGEYHFYNKKMDNCTKKEQEYIRNKEISIVFQKYNLFPQYTVLENVIFPVIYRNFQFKKNIIKDAEKILDEIEMLQFKNKRIYELSGGQQQRVAIARSLLQSPKLLLADEPTANVDETTENIIMRIFDEYKKKNTIIVVSHNSKYSQIADNRLQIVNGGIVNE